MAKWFVRIDDIEAERERVRQARYGMIEAVAGQFRQLQLRPWPKLVSGVEAMWIGGATHARKQRDRVRFWYSQPFGHNHYLILSYAVSEMGTSALTLRAAFRVLDRIAEFKKCDAILCEASNPRLNDRIMKYWGFERHMPNARRKHYIRRFYGEFPAPRNITPCNQLPLPEHRESSSSWPANPTTNTPD
jgi:hypothetical protein